MININDINNNNNNNNNTTSNQSILPIIDCSLVFTTALNDVFASTLSLSSCLSTTPMSPTTPTHSNLSSNSDHDVYHLVFDEKQQFEKQPKYRQKPSKSIRIPINPTKQI